MANSLELKSLFFFLLISLSLGVGVPSGRKSINFETESVSALQGDSDVDADGYDENADCVTVYSECNYLGDSTKFCHSDRYLAGRDWDNKIASFELGGNIHSVTLYDDSKYSGESYTSETKDECLSDDLSKNASSLTLVYETSPVSKNCVRAYDECYYQGDSQEFCSDIEDLDDEEWDNEIASVRIGLKIKNFAVWSDADYEGDSGEYDYDVACFKTDSKLDGQVSSLDLKVNYGKIPDNCVRFFSAPNYDGDVIDFCRDDEDLDGDHWDDKISSFKLGANIERIVLFADWEMEGTREWYFDDVASLDDEGDLDDDVESFRIFNKYIADNCVRLFEHCDYEGDWIDFCLNVHDFNEYGWDNKASAIKLGASVDHAILWSKHNYEGDGYTTLETEDCLDGTGIANTTESIELFYTKNTDEDEQ